jgi:hypothetical protein
MKTRKLMRLNAAIFALVFIGHAARLTNSWDVNVANWAIPMSLSWAAVIIVGYLGWNNYRLSK